MGAFFTNVQVRADARAPEATREAVVNALVARASDEGFTSCTDASKPDRTIFVGPPDAWIAVYDQGTELAIDAYHRLMHWGTYKTIDSRTITYLLNGWGEFKVRYPNHGRHAEGKLSIQLLALIDGSKVDMIFPISSGKPSTPTILGDFHVYSRDPTLAPDGMYYSDYFIRGYAIHGYNPAPDYPASHGCMRLPMVDAIRAYHWLDFGDWVDVYN